MCSVSHLYKPESNLRDSSHHCINNSHSDHTYNYNYINFSTYTTMAQCALCGTSATSQWRFITADPSVPNSRKKGTRKTRMCNACGIRWQRKRRMSTVNLDSPQVTKRLEVVKRATEAKRPLKMQIEYLLHLWQFPTHICICRPGLPPHNLLLTLTAFNLIKLH